MQNTAYEIRISDWSSGVCSSDLLYIDPPVLCPSLFIVTAIEVSVGRDWSCFAYPQHRHAVGSNALRHEIIGHGLCPGFGHAQIVGIASPGVAVPANGDCASMNHFGVLGERIELCA